MIYEFNENLRRWNRVESLQDIVDPVNDLSFAPNLGRSHHMLGVASKDLKVVSLEPQRYDFNRPCIYQQQNCACYIND